MKAKNKLRPLILPTVLIVCLLLSFLSGGIFFKNYLDSRIFEERTTQLKELTSQVRANLGNALDTHWNYITAAVNDLDRREIASVEDASVRIAEIERLLATDRFSSMLMLLDSRGNCYDARGAHGVWSELDAISGGDSRYTFIADSPIYDGSFWTFVQKLDRPIDAQNDEASFTHLILLKDVSVLSEYYDSGAYDNRNETYILKSNGTRMYDDVEGEKTIHSYNVIKVLEEMEGQKYTDIKSALAETDTISSSFISEGEEYCYCVASLAEYDTLLLFLIPSQYVASGTVDMVNTIIRTLLLLALILLLLIAVSAVAVTRQRSNETMLKKEQENLRRQEELNARLEESNGLLANAKESAEQAFRIAEEANRAKSTFLSNMSHDIRTPMNAIIGFSALLMREAEKPEKVREYTRKITSSGQHLLGLINDVLDISKIEAGKTTLNVSDENIVDLIDGIDGIIRPQMKAKGHTFEVISEEVRHENVTMDKLRLNQILLNLLSNAVKYTPDGGRITLTIRELPQTKRQLADFRFIVEDNGYGMTPEYQKTIFHAFTREEDSVTNKIQGTGLGMAITKNLIDLMGGTISVESEKGKGSKFTIELSLPISDREIDRGFWRDRGIARILAVDDEEVVYRNIQMSMEETGVEVDYAPSGRAALDMLKKSERDNAPYDVVILDWQMPDMDGAQTARRIRRELTTPIMIVILTAYDQLELEESETVTEVDAFLTKPFFLTAFRKKVEMAMNYNGKNEGGESADDEESVLNGMNILVAEDNEINAEILSELLEMVGATCEIRENGKLAVEEFERSAPGQYRMILMDVQMPVMNGYDATRAIRELKHPYAKTIPIIAMTANAFAEDVRDAIDAGMNAHVAKPLDMAILEQTVKRVLGEQAREISA
ncbi:MAG: response regulator [Bacteroides sp.]|nr:response regulator [Eubacterium sp.]MCM1417399.1 response regulator [Roseburia sp.]MCM1461408.1 response regulator [Bacteroides sp.]